MSENCGSHLPPTPLCHVTAPSTPISVCATRKDQGKMGHAPLGSCGAWAKGEGDLELTTSDFSKQHVGVRLCIRERGSAL